MPRQCSICRHAKLLAIDRQLLRGEQLKVLAKRFSVSRFGLSRHRKHMAMALAKAAARAEKEDANYGGGLLGQIASIQSDLERLQQNAEAGGDRRGAISAIREKLRSLELTAKLTGQLPDGRAGNVTVVNQGLTFDEALALAREICEAAGLTVIEAPPVLEAHSDQR